MSVIVILLFLFKNTRLFNVHFGLLVREFWTTFLLIPVNFGLVVAVRVYRIVSLLRLVPSHRLWYLPGFYPLFVLQKIVSVVYYYSLYQTSVRLAGPKFRSR